MQLYPPLPPCSTYPHSRLAPSSAPVTRSSTLSPIHHRPRIVRPSTALQDGGVAPARKTAHAHVPRALPYTTPPAPAARPPARSIAAQGGDAPPFMMTIAPVAPHVGSVNEPRPFPATASATRHARLYENDTWVSTREKSRLVVGLSPCNAAWRLGTQGVKYTSPQDHTFRLRPPRPRR